MSSILEFVFCYILINMLETTATTATPTSDFFTKKVFPDDPIFSCPICDERSQIESILFSGNHKDIAPRLAERATYYNSELHFARYLSQLHDIGNPRNASHFYQVCVAIRATKGVCPEAVNILMANFKLMLEFARPWPGKIMIAPPHVPTTLSEGIIRAFDNSFNSTEPRSRFFLEAVSTGKFSSVPCELREIAHRILKPRTFLSERLTSRAGLS